MGKSRIILYLPVFFAIWTIRAFWLIDLDRSIENPETRLIFAALVKILLWFMPAALYAYWVGRSNPFPFLGLSEFPATKTWAICISAIGAFCMLILAFEILAGGKSISLPDMANPDLPSTIAFFFVSPLVEEILFRGLILKELSTLMKASFANAVTSLLFVGIHLPYWIASGSQMADMARDSAGIFLFSLFAGWLYSIGKSVWPPALAHIANNLLTSCISP